MSTITVFKYNLTPNSRLRKWIFLESHNRIKIRKKKTLIILFVFILRARHRKPFQSQLSELSQRQRKGSKVNRTRLNLRQLKQFGRSNLILLLEDFQSLIQNLKLKCSVNFSRIVADKNTQVFSHNKQKTNCSRRVFFINERQPNSPEHEDRSG